MKLQLMMMVIVMLMVCGDINDNGKGGHESDGEKNDGTDEYKNDCNDYDGCLNSVKNCFKNKQIVLENFSLPVLAR